MENTQTNDIYIMMLFCDGCENHGNNRRQMERDKCDRLGEYAAVAGVVTDLIWETKARESHYRSGLKK